MYTYSFLHPEHKTAPFDYIISFWEKKAKFYIFFKKMLDIWTILYYHKHVA
ncbi:hypothetical protein HMPREF2738_02864 [Clostridiales bacterium KLE1615]|nr:hypothetical protein HMPREF2738_02864 [Clostridiales bacterium KLE1615]